MEKLQGTVIEMREDANEESIRNALSPSRNEPKSNLKGDGKDKAAAAQGGKGNAKLDDAKTEPALAVVKAKPKGGGQDKGRDKGKGPGKGKQKGGSETRKGKALGGLPAKAKPKAEIRSVSLLPQLQSRGCVSIRA